MKSRRVDRLNSLLKEVISEVISQEVRNPRVSSLISVTRVDVTSDLQHAKVYISIIGNEAQKAETLQALNSGAGFIGVNASKRVSLRFFPSLTFFIDNSVDAHMKIDKILQDIEAERKNREPLSE